MRSDYYELLDVAPSASSAELKRAYYKQARRYHPDYNPGDADAEERFKLVAEAWRVLGDEQERRNYDDWLEKNRRYADAPELAQMTRHIRVSARHGKERRSGNRRDAGRRRARPFLLRKVLPVGMWSMVVFYAMVAFMIVPMFLRGCGILMQENQRAVEKESSKKTTKKSPEEVRAALHKANEELRQRAEAGDVEAQARYALVLYNGWGMNPDRPAAKLWFERAAAAGHVSSASWLQRLNFAPVAPREPRPVEDDIIRANVPE